MSEGQTIEVSTGYFADDVVEAGEVNGKKYRVRHVNLRPDHVALLPGQVGACSIADGCGAPRVNQDERKPIANALSALMRALGLKPNDCNCEEPTMSKAKELAAMILADIALLPAAVKVNIDTADLEKMSETALTGLAAWVKAIQKATKPGDEEDPAMMKKNAAAAAAAAAAAPPAALTVGQLTELVTNTVEKVVAKAIGAALSGDAIATTVKRGEIKARLLANSACAFTAAELDTMSAEALGKYEKSIRPADYSGAGGFHAQAGGEEIEMPFRGGVLARLRDDAAAKKQ